MHDPRTSAWLPAYQNISDPAPKCDEPEPSPGSWKTERNYPTKDWGEFTKDVWQIVQDAIDHTCRAAGNQDVGTAAVEQGV